MILDRIENCEKYAGLHSGFAAAFSYLKKAGVPSKEGRYDIDGDKVYALVQSYATRPAAEIPWESHRKYIDIQFVARGREMMEWASVQTLRQNTDYDGTADFIGYDDPPEKTVCLLDAGTLALLFPEDAHKPRCNVTEPCNVMKIVIKVACE